MELNEPFESESTRVNAQGLADRFSRAAPQYESYARIQRQVSKTLWDWTLTHLHEKPRPLAAIDVGCGTGFLTAQLLRTWSDMTIHAIDIAPGMIEQIQQNLPFSRLQVHQMDGENLSVETLWVPPNSLLISSMCAQWFKNLEQTIRQWLTVSNTVAFSILLSGSFEAWHRAHESTGQTAGLQPLPSGAALDELTTRLKTEGVCKELHSFRRDLLDQHFDGLSFARSLRAIGADAPRARHRPVNLKKVISELGTGCTMNYRVGFYFLSRS